MGPINDEMTEVYSANLLNRLNFTEQLEFKQLRERRRKSSTHRDSYPVFL